MKKVLSLIILFSTLSTNASAFDLFDKKSKPDNQNITQQNRQGKAKGKRKERLQKLIQQLGLSDEQVAKFKEIKSRHRDSMQTLKEDRNRMKALQKEIQQFMASTGQSDSDRSTILNKVDTVHEIKGRLKKRRIEMALDIREILTSEQLIKFNTLRAQRKSGRKRGGKRKRFDQ